MRDEIKAHRDLAWDFLAKGREHLAEGNLHQAAEKGWGAAAHNHFHRAISRVRQSTGNDRLRLLQGRAEILHVNFYDVDLDAAQIEKARG